MNPVRVALRGKGPFNLLRRGVSVVQRYGLSPRKLDRQLAQLAAVLSRFHCNATLPITSVTLQRHPHLIREYRARGIEFAIHGYLHVDLSQLSHAEQQAQLQRAKQIFEKAGIPTQGFRGPYLGWNEATLEVLQHLGLVYDSSQGLAWDVLDGHTTSAYNHVLSFYGALSATDYPSLPSLEDGLVRIPYSLPDDEALVERLELKTPAQMTALWLGILHRTHELGELFALGLHPERTTICLEPLTALLAEACQLDPPVWIARMDEIAGWWRARSGTQVHISETPDNCLQVAVAGPAGTTVLVRGVRVDAPTQPGADGYQQVRARKFTMPGSPRPFIGISPPTSPHMADFLRQQGYLVETSDKDYLYAHYYDQPEFAAEHKRPMLAQIEDTDGPLVRLGRWPNGARSALSITGDIDALTLWDYGLRFLGR
jgi:hypothetical protein